MFTEILQKMITDRIRQQWEVFESEHNSAKQKWRRKDENCSFPCLVWLRPQRCLLSVDDCVPLGFKWAGAFEVLWLSAKRGALYLLQPSVKPPIAPLPCADRGGPEPAAERRTTARPPRTPPEKSRKDRGRVSMECVGNVSQKPLTNLYFRRDS